MYAITMLPKDNHHMDGIDNLNMESSQDNNFLVHLAITQNKF